MGRGRPVIGGILAGGGGRECSHRIGRMSAGRDQGRGNVILRRQQQEGARKRLSLTGTNLGGFFLSDHYDVFYYDGKPLVIKSNFSDYRQVSHMS